MKKLATLMILGSIASLSANNYCPNCPSGSYYQGGQYDQGNYQGGYQQSGNYYDNSGYNQGSMQGYYQDGGAPRYVGTRPMSQENRNDTSTYMNRQSTNDNSKNMNTNGSDLNKKVRDALSGGWFSQGYQNVTFEMNNGDVTLRGTVNSAEDKKNAEEAVRKIDGVRNVNNRITVNMDSMSQNGNDNTRNKNNNYERTTSFDNRNENMNAQDSGATSEDKQLNARIRDKIQGGWFSKQYDTLILRTSNGIVVISGVVDSQDDADKIHDEVKKVEGVRSVNNQLTVKKNNR